MAFRALHDALRYSIECIPNVVASLLAAAVGDGIDAILQQAQRCQILLAFD